MLVNFLSALALVMVLEGLMPFASPQRWKQVIRRILEQSDRRLRMIGFFSMSVGVVILTIIHQFAE
ncbi:DUF2065 domain-containing protein [Legionella sp. CNM-4043-24]|uniref:DUF2065 domain-containing protein n=1 Tax=Legionella sp. CNM-4043-24 TaxID=3421646 RepID=UPI00403AD5E2